MQNLIPKPASTKLGNGAFELTTRTKIIVKAGDAEVKAIGQFLANQVIRAAGFSLPVISTSVPPISGNIYLVGGGDPELGEEGYELKITPENVTLTAHCPAGLFYGVQTLRQLFPVTAEISLGSHGSWVLPAGVIRDRPRFPWRGAMLDVARHFFSVNDVKRYLDLCAFYKLNRFHLHLTDDQGWRIMIHSWSRLATYGGSTAVGGDPGGFYTQDEYSSLVRYAQERYITIIPEIEMPAHTQAALSSYPELTQNGKAKPLYTGIEVGFSSLDANNEETYRFMNDVVGEMAAITPGAYLHIGGDEALSTKKEDYRRMISSLQKIVTAHGKHMIGWEEIAQVDLLPTTVVQLWHSSLALRAAAQGNKVILSPAERTYLDMKYDETTALGLNWAGYVDVQAAYDWEPIALLPGELSSAIMGVEAPLWTETIQTMSDLEFMVFPKLLGIAEIGWSPLAGRNWDEYKLRLAAHGQRLSALGVNYYRSHDVNWTSAGDQR